MVKGKAVLAAICGLFLAFGVAAALALATRTSHGLASLEWPSVKGEIVLAMRHTGRNNLKRFEYRYSVGRAAYTGGRAAFVRVPYVDPLYRKYRSGMPVRVYYDPGDPARSVVEPGAPLAGVLAEAIVPLVMLGLGAAGLFYGFRRQEPDQR